MAFAKITILLLFASNIIFAQTPQQYFGEKYTTALTFVKSHKSLFLKYFEKKDAIKAVAIVFPEVLRYNTLANEAEIQLLKSLYVRFGKKYADFSVGYFQMKPSFVETLENISGKNLADTPENREKRLEKMMSVEGQILYLKDYWDIMHTKYPNMHHKNDVSQIRFLASAYNYGFLSSEDKILNWSVEKAFPSGKNSAVRFSYADISENFYLKEIPKIFR
ncbi:MAG: hypothetical protein MUC49_03390 [Raineya sp.]|jgi:hypothetical protein|nr:hypothetical protein [Raineya sp.]